MAATGSPGPDPSPQSATRASEQARENAAEISTAGKLEAASPPTAAPLHVVLYQPLIPQNTGNIARSCVALGAKLWIVRPTAFRLDSSQLKRAGLDYWQYLAWEMVDSWEELLSRFEQPRLWLITKFGELPYYEATFTSGDLLVLGRETNGLPESLRREYADRQINIPMPGPVRSLNQANAAAIVMYEAARQIGLLAPSQSLGAQS